MQSMKETAANVAASAKAGMEKTKATVEEKVEKMRASDPMEKAMATERKEERMTEAELSKQEAREQNAAAKQASKVGGHNPGYTATGTIARVDDETEDNSTADYIGGRRTAAYSYSSGGEYGMPTGGQQMSAMPGHGTGQPAGGHVTEGVVETHPIGMDTGTGRTTAHNTRVEGAPGPGYRTGGTYSG